MAVAKRPAAHLDGYDKKHDEPVHSQTWQPASRMRPVTFLRKKRLAVGLLVIAAVYLFVSYLPTDVPPAGARVDYRTGHHQGSPLAKGGLPKEEPYHAKVLNPGQLYDGPVKFYNLAGSLRPHLYKQDRKRDDVLFMLNDLRAASSLTGLACVLAVYNRTNVHIGLVSQAEATIQEIADISGIKEEDCPVFWHDARPDYYVRSSKERHDASIKSAVSHMHATLKPTVVVVDEHQASNIRFKTALLERLDHLRVPLTVVPNSAATSMSWVTTLDAKGLAVLNQNQVDIVIMPYKNSAGSLIRLLESIRSADYSGLPLPRITVELPQEIDGFALNYLEQFRWPLDGQVGPSRLTLHRHLDTKTLTPALSSLQTVESFYPPSQPMSHVLVLSPDVELSENYMQYLYYLTLEYKYGRSGQRIAGSLTGIALDRPDHSLNEKDLFVSATTPDTGGRPLLLARIPSSQAALYFGDHWVELQDYLTLRLKHDPVLSKRIKGSAEASISSKYPAWLTLQWELMQMRNGWMLYPSLPEGEKLVTVHAESTQAAEEFWKEPKKPEPASVPSLEGDILTGEDVHANMDHSAVTRPSTSILKILGLKNRELLPQDTELTYLTATGKVTDLDSARLMSEVYAPKIAEELGDCKSIGDSDDELIGQLRYLFCIYNDAGDYVGGG